MLRTTVVGNYPKLPTEKGDVNIRRKLHQFDKKEITREELDQAFDQVTARVIREEIDAGIDLPTDGQIRWDDIVSPFAAAGEGFKIGGLLRWFDNNVYYRRPQIVSRIRWSKPISVSDYLFAAAQAGRAVKQVLPAPYSFAMLSEDKFYHSLENTLADLVILMREETKSLVAAGARCIQFDDPWLPYHPEHASVAVAAINEVVKGINAEFWISFYFSNIDKIIPQLKSLNVDVISADCVSHPSNLELLMRLGGDKNICFGLVDARNIKMESGNQLRSSYETIAAARADAYISPSCGLEFLPNQHALAKIRLLGGSVKKFNGE